MHNSAKIAILKQQFIN